MSAIAEKVIATPSSILKPEELRLYQDAFLSTDSTKSYSERWKYSHADDYVDFFINETEARNSAIRLFGNKANLATFRELNTDDRFDLIKAGLSQAGDRHLVNLNGYKQHVSRLLYVADGGEAELQLIGESNSCERLIIEVGRDASLYVVEEAQGGNRVMEMNLQPNAKVEHKVTKLPLEDIEYTYHSVFLDDHAEYSLSIVSSGARQRLNEVAISCPGDHTDVKLDAGWQVQPQSSLEQHVLLRHMGQFGKSQQKCRGIIADDGRSTFAGTIRIDEDASGTVASLNNRNIALGDRAVINAKPELLIYNDDVQCSHGATTSQLDADLLFYFQSRGVNYSRARQLLLRAFLRELIPDDSRLDQIAMPHQDELH